MLPAGGAPPAGRIPFNQQHELLAEAREGGAHQFARQSGAGLRHRKEHEVEVASLSLVDGQRIRQFQIVLGLAPEIAVRDVWLCGKGDVEPVSLVPGRSAGHDPYLSVGDVVEVGGLLRPSILRAVVKLYDLVCPDDFLVAEGRGLAF